MNWRNRWTFWATIVAVLSLVSLPSIEWVSTFGEYCSFLSGWEPSPLKITRTSFTPHESTAAIEEPTMRPVEFRFHGRKAKSVELVGDFNAWKPGLLKMSRGDNGAWRAVVPVPQGRHKYLFLVDGEPRVDEKAETTDGPQGRRVSVMTVK